VIAWVAGLFDWQAKGRIVSVGRVSYRSAGNAWLAQVYISTSISGRGKPPGSFSYGRLPGKASFFRWQGWRRLRVIR